jgi:hypothetical protein
MPGQEPKGETPAAPPAEATPPRPRETLDLFVAPAYGHVFLSGTPGRRADFYHYQTPPTGPFLGYFNVIRRAPQGWPVQQFWWRNAGAEDEKGYLELHGWVQPSYFRLWQQMASFYGDPLLPNGDWSSRDDTRMRYHAQHLPPAPAVDFYFWDQRVSIPTIARLTPFTGIDYHAPEVGVRATHEVGEGQLYIRSAYRLFDNVIGVGANPDRLPSSDTAWASGDYARPLSHRTDFDLGAGWSATNITGHDALSANYLRVAFNTRVSDNVALDTFYRLQRQELPLNEYSYANRHDLAGVDLNARPRPGLRLGAGLFREEVDRTLGELDLDQPTGSGLVSPAKHDAWTGAWARVTATPASGWYADARYLLKNLSDPPPAALAGLPSRNTLYYTLEQQLNARVDRPIGLRTDLYFLYLWRMRQNQPRQLQLSLNSATLGATRQVSNRLSVTAESTGQIWSGDEDIFLANGGASPLPPSLFFTTGIVLTTSAAYQIDPRSSLEAAYNYYLGLGGQTAGDHLAVVQYRRDVTRNFFYLVGWEFDQFRDDRLDRSYRGMPILLQAGWKQTFDLPGHGPRHGRPPKEKAAPTPETPAPETPMPETPPVPPGGKPGS